ncbi:MAG: hypothetical protein PWP57_725 [Candidatus Atribacteria bacterium]|nr:hypothetical protein [Candidatus Atribacteria bacterium]
MFKIVNSTKKILEKLWKVSCPGTEEDVFPSSVFFILLSFIFTYAVGHLLRLTTQYPREKIVGHGEAIRGKPYSLHIKYSGYFARALASFSQYWAVLSLGWSDKYFSKAHMALW